jgi:hypothetical protein
MEAVCPTSREGIRADSPAPPVAPYGGGCPAAWPQKEWKMENSKINMGNVSGGHAVIKAIEKNMNKS